MPAFSYAQNATIWPRMAHKGRRGADICRRMGNDGDGRSRRQGAGQAFHRLSREQAAGAGAGSKLKIEFSGQGAAEDGQHRQAAGAGGREPRTAGAAGRTREQDSRQAWQESRPDEDGGRSSGRHDFPLSSAQIHLLRYLY